jgi:hypothetical protein
LLLLRLRYGLWLGRLLLLLLVLLMLSLRLCLGLLLLNMLLLRLLLLSVLLSLLVLLLLLLLLLDVLLLLESRWHRLSALLLLHVLYLGIRWRGMRVLELRDGWRAGRRSRCHLLGMLSSLGVVEGRVRHVGIVARRRRCLRRVRLGRREIRAWSANVPYS